MVIILHRGGPGSPWIVISPGLRDGCDHGPVVTAQADGSRELATYSSGPCFAIASTASSIARTCMFGLRAEYTVVMVPSGAMA